MTNNENNANYTHVPDEAAFGGRFTDFKQIGEGGMGSVYRAHDTILQKTVAIKVLNIEHGRNEKNIARLQKEAKALAKLSHPSIITIFDFGLTNNDEPYIVMEFLKGYTLDSYLKSEDYFAWDDSIYIFEQVANALDYAHQKGIIHRDLKPSNIFILDSDSDKQEIKLIDFGISAIVETDQGQTTSGTMIGSPLYMSPEQTQSSSVDGRSDIYSFGCLIFRSLTGKVPIEGSTANEIILLKRTTKPPKLSDTRSDVEFSQQLEQFVDKCLQINPSNRYSNMNEVEKAMDIILQADQKENNQNTEKEQKTEVSIIKLSIVLICALFTTATLILLAIQIGSKKSTETKDTVKRRFEIEGIAAIASKANVEEKVFRDEPISKPFTDSDGYEWNQFSGNIDAAFIKKHKRCDYIHLYHLKSKVADEILEALVAKKPIGLNLNKSGLTDRQFPILTKLPNLKYLSIGGCNDVTEKSIGYLTIFKSLETLGISAKHLRGKEMNQIVHLPKLTTLSFLGQSKFRKNAISKLKRDRPYKSIGITSAELKNAEMKLLSTDLNTESLNLYELRINDEQMNILAKTNASNLTLSECTFGKNKIKEFAKNKSLKKLVLIKSQVVSQSDITFLENTMGARCKIYRVLE